jgi:cytochrome P450
MNPCSTPGPALSRGGAGSRAGREEARLTMPAPPGSAARPRYVPPHPPRGTGPVPVWRGFFGERARTSVYGWSVRAFTDRHIRRNVMSYTVHVPLDPASVQRVLLDNAANYAKPDLVKKLLAPVIGRGLLTADAALWRTQRRIVAASFAPGAVDALVPAFAQAAAAAMARWQPGVRDMAAESTAATMRVIADTLFAGDRRLKTAEGMAHIAAALDAMSDARLPALLGLPVLPLTPRLRAGRRGQAYLRRTLEEVVRSRGEGGEDFLGRLIAALRRDFPAAEAAELAADNAATFYLAGHETTANALTWSLFLLAEQSALQEEAAAEARAALAGAPAETVGSLPLLRRILDEALRLYPPVPRFDRQAIAEDELAGHRVARGDFVSIWPWLLQRHQALWDDPDAFDPARWEGDGPVRHRFQYIPFGAGPRVCVGARFATVEALVLLAHWLAAWRFAPIAGRQVRASGIVTLRPAGGLPLRLARR